MLQPTQRLGDFEIVRLLGKGGMGEVYEARQLNPDRQVAIKVLSGWLAENDEALTRFWREAEVPARLDHPNIVRIISTGKSENIAYYAMQLVRGISLAELVRDADGAAAEVPPHSTTDPNRQDPTTCDQETILPPPGSNGSGTPPPIAQEYRRDRFRTAARIGVQAARALASAHEQGYLHRDIKPSNLMVDHHNQLYLVDFGLTRALSTDSEISRQGMIVGTPWFMSPEQARGEPLDERSDLFSLGVTLYQLATGGKGPYTASRLDSDAVLRQVRDGSSVPLSRIVPQVPALLERIISRAVDPLPERRYQSMRELASDLEAYLDPEVATRTWQVRLPRPPGRLRLTRAQISYLMLAVAAVAILIFGLALGANLAFQPAREFNPWKDARPLSVRQPLLRDDNQPLASRRLAGSGTLAALPTVLTLTSTDPTTPTLFALAGVPNQGFEFSVELKQADSANPEMPKAHNLGVFFGWQETPEDSLARNRFFVTQLDRRPVLKDQFGRLKLGSACLGEAEGALFDFFRPLPQDKGWIPLANPGANENPWRTVVVRVHDQKMRVSVDKLPPREFDVAWLQFADAWLKPYPMEPRGLLGIWVRNGHGSFRNATLMALSGSTD